MKSAFYAIFLLPLFGAASPSTVVQRYADQAHADYTASLESALSLQDSIENFLNAPSPESLAQARAAWIEARKAYSPTEVYRFFEGPIDGVDGPEGFINAWPLDEAYIDYVEGSEGSGIINNLAAYPEITKELLVSLNESEGETNISTGFHAIEFLLWGQDLDENGPGNRPFTDYVPGIGKNAERRSAYLAAAAELLVEHLLFVAQGWKPLGPYALSFTDPQGSNESLRKILLGAYRLAGDELAHERMFVAVEAQQQEDEQSCFSDTTHLDILYNFLGVKKVLTAQGGPLDLIKGENAEAAEHLKERLRLAELAVRDVPAPFDQAIFSAEGKEKILMAVSALEDLADSIRAAALTLGIELE